METSQIVLVAFILSLVLYNYSGLYVSRKSGAKIPFWSTIIKGKDIIFSVSDSGLIMELLFIFVLSVYLSASIH